MKLHKDVTAHLKVVIEEEAVAATKKLGNEDRDNDIEREGILWVTDHDSCDRVPATAAGPSDRESVHPPH